MPETPGLTAGTPAGTHSSATALGRGIHFQAAAGSAGPRPWYGGGQYWWLTVAAVLPKEERWC